MKGSVIFEKDRKRWAVSFPFRGKRYKIRRYKGDFMHNKKVAHKCLAIIQADYELCHDNNIPFQIEKYTGKGEWTDVNGYYKKWMKDVIEPKRSPATIKGYWSYYRNWIKPFFARRRIQLHQIQLDTLTALLNSIKLSGKGKSNVMMALHSMMDYAWRSKRIPEMPPFPKRDDYNIVEPKIDWIDSGTFWKVVENISAQDRAPILWMYFHLMREAEACALQWDDWDEINQTFWVSRSISARKIVDRTKTKKIYPAPCHSAFLPIMKELSRDKKSKFVFTNPRARKDGKRYTNESLNNIWRAACKKVGVKIKLYAAIRHSRATQMSLELGMSESEIFEAGPWVRRDSVQKYRSLELQRKRDLLERGEVIPFGKKGPKSAPSGN
jgi:integrase